MRRILYLTVIILFSVFFGYSLPLQKNSAKKVYCKNKIENRLYLAYLKVKKEPTKENYCNFFKILDEWGYKTCFEFQCPQLQKLGSDVYSMLLDEAVKGNECAIRSYVLSSVICYDEQSGWFTNCVEYLESQYEDFGEIAKKHLDKLFDVLLTCNPKLQKYVLDNLYDYYFSESVGEYKTKYLHKNIEKLKKVKKYEKFINYITRDYNKKKK